MSGYPTVTLSSLDGPATAAESAPPAPLPRRTAAVEVSPARARSSRVAESYGLDLGTLIGGGWGLSGGDPSMSDRYGGFWPADRVALPNHAPSGVFSEIQHRAIVSWSRFLCERNMLAIGFRDHVRNFIGPCQVQFVRRGQNPGTQDADGNGVPDDPVVAACQQVWEEWCEAHSWGQGEEDRERECRERLIEDGEPVLRVGPGERGGDFLPWVRFVEPEQIRRPTGTVPEVPGVDPDDVDWDWGVATLRRDAETVLGYWVADPDSRGAAGEFVPADEIVRTKGNVKRSMKRGLPDFFPVEGHLQVALGLLSNLGTTGKAQSAVAWIQQYATATPDQVVAMLRQGADAYARYAPPAGPQQGTTVSSAGGAVLPVKDYPGGTVIHADQNRQYAPGPVSQGVPSFVQVVDSTLKATGFRWGIPDWFTSGDGQSFAAALVTGSPFARSIEDRQGQMIGFVRALALRVLALAERSGRLKAGASRAVRAVVTAKPVVIADEEKQSRTFLSLLDKNVADPIDFIKKRGGDPKVVAANIQAWQAKFKDQPPGGQQPPPGGPGPGGQDPTPAPPGSAGGDGSSPNEPADGGDLGALLGEGLARAGGVWVSEAAYELVGEAGREGLVKKEITNKAGRKQTVWVKPADAAPKETPAKKEPAPKPEPKPKAEKPAKPDPKAAKAAAKTAVSAVAAKIKAGEEVHPDDLAAMPAHLAAMTVPEITALKKELGLKGGATKDQHVQALIAHAKAKAAGTPKEEPAAPADEHDPETAYAALTPAARAEVDAFLANHDLTPKTLAAAAAKDPAGVAARLAGGFARAKTQADRDAITGLMSAVVPGLKPIGHPGHEVPFEGLGHEAKVGVSTGKPVTVTRQGWEVHTKDGKRVVALPAQVEPVGAKPAAAGTPAPAPAAGPTAPDAPHARARAALDAMGLPHDHLTDEQAAGLYDQIRDLHAAAGKAPAAKKPAKPKAERPTGEHLDAAEKLAKDLEARGPDLFRLNKADRPAGHEEAFDRDSDALSAALKKMRPADLKELSLRLTGVPGKDGTDALLRIKNHALGEAQHIRSQDA